jgi:hypothetical protein
VGKTAKEKGTGVGMKELVDIWAIKPEKNKKKSRLRYRN